MKPRPRDAIRALAAISFAGLAGFAALAGCSSNDAATLVMDAGPPSVVAPPLPGRFVEIPGAAPFVFPPPDPLGQRDPPLTGGEFVDLDGDGRPEVVLWFNGVGVDAAYAVYRYDGARLVPTAAPFPDPVMLFADLDGDGNPDAIFGREIAWGDSGGHFGARMPLPGKLDARLALFDLDGDGRTDIFFTSFDAPPAQVLLQTAPRQFELRTPFTGGASVSSNATMALRMNGQLTTGVLGAALPDASAKVPVLFRVEGDAYEPWNPTTRNLSQETPMGAAVADLDGDGRSELLVALHPDHAVLRDDSEAITAFEDVLSDNGKPMIPWGIAALDLDLDGRLDLLATHGGDTLFSPEVRGIGKERTTAHWNGGGGAFGRFASLGDLDRLGEWRALAIGDLDGDGDPDLIVGGFNEDPHVYRNDVTGSAVSLRLHDRNGGPGWGARVIVSAGAISEHFEVASIASPAAWSEPLVFAGLGGASEARVDVTWPSGATQTVEVPAGRLSEVREPTMPDSP